LDSHKSEYGIKDSMVGTIEKLRLNRKLECYFFEFKNPNDFDLFIDSDLNSNFYICVNLSNKDSLNLIIGSKSIFIPPYASFLIPYQDEDELHLNGIADKLYHFIVLKTNMANLDYEQSKLIDTLYSEVTSWNGSTSEIPVMPNLALCEVAHKLKDINKNTCENKFIASGYA